MAEERIEDTKSPIPRRGVRPFVGPAGASPAARPLLRPTAPSPRSGPAPFAPPSAKPRQALGTAPASQPPTAPAAAKSPPPALAPLAASTPVAPPEIATRAPTPVAVAPVVPVVPSALPEPDPFFPVDPAAAVEEHSRPARPITSEMVALDAFDAFDTVWASSDSYHTPAPQPPTPAPLDPESLGSGFDTFDAWAEDVTAGDTGASRAEPVETTAATPSIGIPAWLADDHEPTPSDADPTGAAVPEPSPVDAPMIETESSINDLAPASWSPPAATLADDASTEWSEAPAAETPQAEPVSHAQSLGDALAALAESHNAVGPEVTAPTEDRPRFELVDEPRAAGSAAAPAPLDPRVAHGLRVSAALDRLAQQVRRGEIDISSVAPEATDAAVLASVLAALLGGSSSR